MKKTMMFVLVLFCVKSFAQKTFTNCSAAFLNNKMIVSEYTDTAKCKILLNSKGELNVGTVELSGKNSKLVNKFEFGIAIKDKNTGTLVLFSKETYKKIDIQKVLAKCRKGDSIVLMTLNNEYALPHNEMLVQ